MIITSRVLLISLLANVAESLADRKAVDDRGGGLLDQNIRHRLQPRDNDVQPLALGHRQRRSGSGQTTHRAVLGVLLASQDHAHLVEDVHKRQELHVRSEERKSVRKRASRVTHAHAQQTKGKVQRVLGHHSLRPDAQLVQRLRHRLAPALDVRVVLQHVGRKVNQQHKENHGGQGIVCKVVQVGILSQGRQPSLDTFRQVRERVRNGLHCCVCHLSLLCLVAGPRETEAPL